MKPIVNLCALCTLLDFAVIEYIFKIIANVITRKKDYFTAASRRDENKQKRRREINLKFQLSHTYITRNALSKAYVCLSSKH